MKVLLEVYVQPGAKKTTLSGKHDGRLKIRLSASPISGKANQELITFMAQLLKRKKQDIQIVRGEKSRFKLFSIQADSELIEQLKALDLVFGEDL